MSGENVLSTQADGAPGNMLLNLINASHGLNSVVSFSAGRQPEGFVSSDAVSTNIRAGALHEGHKLELF